MFISTLLLFLNGCANHNSHTKTRKEKTEFDVENQVKIYLLHDTINSGETQKLMVDIDTVYYTLLHGRPKMDFAGISLSVTLKGPVKSYQTMDTRPGQNATTNREVIEKFWFKLREDKDAVITFSGSYIMTNFSSSKRSEGTLINGKKQLEWKFWYDEERENLKEISNWLNGVKKGKTEVFRENGSYQRFQITIKVGWMELNIGTHLLVN